MIKAFSIGIPVTGTADNSQPGIGKLYTGRNRDGPPVKCIKTIDIQVIGDFGMTAYTGYQNDIIE
jgi:hypothetical protein